LCDARGVICPAAVCCWGWEFCYTTLWEVGGGSQDTSQAAGTYTQRPRLYLAAGGVHRLRVCPPPPSHCPLPHCSPPAPPPPRTAAPPCPACADTDTTASLPRLVHVFRRCAKLVRGSTSKPERRQECFQPAQLQLGSTTASRPESPRRQPRAIEIIHCAPATPGRHTTAKFPGPSAPALQIKPVRRSSSRAACWAARSCGGGDQESCMGSRDTAPH
jgi:hypothetical protein